MISTFTAFIDANVFYGARLRSLVLFVAQSKLYRARWSERVHDEWIDAVVRKTKRPSVTRDSLQSTREDMNAAVLDCLVENYEHLEVGLQLPDAKDKHVLAAAIHGHASTIVTFNLKDFPNNYLAQFKIHATHPDQFLIDAYYISPDHFIEAVRLDFLHYKYPPLTFAEYIEALRNAGVPKLAEILAELEVLIA
jgi:predicted nucleic acid-binding protein